MITSQKSIKKIKGVNKKKKKNSTTLPQKIPVIVPTH